jgi:hypothetical protein
VRQSLPLEKVVSYYDECQGAAKEIITYRRDYSNLNESNLIHDVECIDWDNELTNFGEASVMFDTFYLKLSRIIDSHIPVKQTSKRKLKQQAKPWITKGIRKYLTIKNKLYKKYIKTRSLYCYYKFKQYRTKLNHVIKTSKSSYYNDYFNKNNFHIINIKLIYNISNIKLGK